MGMTLQTSGEQEAQCGGYVRHGPLGGLGMVISNALKVGMPVWEKGGDISQMGGEFVLGPGCVVQSIPVYVSQLKLYLMQVDVHVRAPDAHKARTYAHYACDDGCRFGASCRASQSTRIRLVRHNV